MLLIVRCPDDQNILVWVEPFILFLIFFNIYINLCERIQSFHYRRQTYMIGFYTLSQEKRFLFYIWFMPVSSSRQSVYIRLIILHQLWYKSLQFWFITLDYCRLGSLPVFAQFGKMWRSWEILTWNTAPPLHS